MTETRPSLRAERHWAGPGGPWTFDVWGSTGRPVLCLHGLTLDRSSWWPAAAQLAAECTVIAVDLPGHGGSPDRLNYPLPALVDELAALLAHLDLRRAPIVVGHAESALLATMFGTAFATHAVVAVEPETQLAPPDGTAVDTLAAGLGVDSLPPAHRPLAAPRPDPAILSRYLQSRNDLTGPDPRHHLATLLRRIRAPYLSVFGRLPWPGYREWLRRLNPNARCAVYGTRSRLPQLADTPRFVADLRSLRLTRR